MRTVILFNIFIFFKTTFYFFWKGLSSVHIPGPQISMFKSLTYPKVSIKTQAFKKYPNNKNKTKFLI